jgi:predicted HTH domain antitoxin
MQVRLTIPDGVAADLDPGGTDDLGRRALEALAIEGYRTEALSLGQVAEMLGLSIDEADGFLKAHGVELILPIEDFARDATGLEELLSK